MGQSANESSDRRSKPDHQTLIRRAQANDPGAIGQLYELYQDAVYKYVYFLALNSEIAEDITQDTFVRMMTNVMKYEDRGKFDAWLFRIAHNCMADHWKSVARRNEFTQLYYDLASDNDIDDNISLKMTLSRLDWEDQEIIYLRDYIDLPYDEVAEILEIRVGTAKMRHHRAIGKLRDHFGEMA